jgi:hypothetical protein
MSHVSAHPIAQKMFATKVDSVSKKLFIQRLMNDCVTVTIATGRIDVLNSGKSYNQRN